MNHHAPLHDSRTASLPDPVLDRLLTTLDVEVDAFAVCEVAEGARLTGVNGPAIEAHYVLAGTLHFEMPDGPPLTCGPGGVVLVPPHMPQGISAGPAPTRSVAASDHCTVGTDGLLRIDAARGGEGDLRMICGHIRANVAGSFGLLDTIRAPLVAELGEVPAIAPLVNEAYRAMLREIARPQLGSRAVAAALMKTCLLLALRDHFAHAGHGVAILGALRDPRLGRAVTAVLDSPAARHSVAGLAYTAGMSRSAFAREFTDTFAISPMAFVARTRLHHAAGLLKSTRLPVKVIAATIGFSSRSHFSRAFRDAHGVDPTAYRVAAAQEVS